MSCVVLLGVKSALHSHRCTASYPCWWTLYGVSYKYGHIAQDLIKGERSTAGSGEPRESLTPCHHSPLISKQSFVDFVKLHVCYSHCRNAPFHLSKSLTQCHHSPLIRSYASQVMSSSVTWLPLPLQECPSSPLSTELTCLPLPLQERPSSPLSTVLKVVMTLLNGQEKLTQHSTSSRHRRKVC